MLLLPEPHNAQAKLVGQPAIFVEERGGGILGQQGSAGAVPWVVASKVVLGELAGLGGLAWPEKECWTHCWNKAIGMKAPPPQ